ncbi:2-aminomuconic semialdehyde dehydrogenase-like isoform X2 [Xenia sp. Carnegie-2017]|uniref:2-aminomuconic semialdehyde dehydrogenase-like isoform X2 n=1 Tax=Xenia sp. Carnegie-2017 TaxID=2897299 RepID=UPI001F04AC35|nr:2-aminomuconic semialdehyde dehydrogenase-like isoform X2 [Xenia sp. Carnegie-2017]
MAELLTLENFINGEFLPCTQLIDSYEPSTGKPYVRVPDSDKTEVDAAVKAAKNAFPIWSKTPVKERANLMMKIADIVESRLQQFAEAESKDQGKPIWLAALVDIPRVVLNMRSFAIAIQTDVNRSTVLHEQGAVNYTTSNPVGVAGLISPWNLPLYLLTFKIAPAIASGNTVVCKPSEMTSVTAWMFAKVLNEAGLPPGVVNIVFGLGPKCGAALVQHPDVPIVSFTGSTATGQYIIENSAPYFKKLSLELGGKNAAIVFDDCDLAKVIPGCIRSGFANQGEVCLSTSRIFVQRSIYETFLEKFVTATKNLKVGNPSDKDTKIGALISKEHLSKVLNYVKIACKEGGIIKCGHGKDLMDLPEENKNGYFMLPTVITGLKDESTCMQEEIFGPVVCVSPFETEEEVIVRANNVKYGLCASIWSENVGRHHRIAQQLEVGTVWCNSWLLRDLKMPFGGVKASGLGREGIFESLEFYTNTKTVCVKY